MGSIDKAAEGPLNLISSYDHPPILQFLGLNENISQYTGCLLLKVHSGSTKLKPDYDQKAGR